MFMFLILHAADALFERTGKYRKAFYQFHRTFIFFLWPSAALMSCFLSSGGEWGEGALGGQGSSPRSKGGTAQ